MAYYPPVGFHFKVEFQLDGVTTNDVSFQEVGGLSVEIATEELVEGGVNTYSHRLPGRAKYGNLVLKRGMLTNSGLIDWFKQSVEEYRFSPITMSVHLLNSSHEPLVVWNFDRAWPVKWVVSDLKAQDSGIVVETIEFAYRSFRKTVNT